MMFFHIFQLYCDMWFKTMLFFSCLIVSAHVVTLFQNAWKKKKKKRDTDNTLEKVDSHQNFVTMTQWRSFICFLKV